MCGIAGTLGSVGVEKAAEAAVLSLAHRGPDDSGAKTLPVGRDGRCLTLVHRRLGIIDLSSLGHQPMTDPETGNWIVYNGEIVNFRELRAELEARGLRFRSESDTEVVLKLWGVHGRGALDRLCGMFAFALWDATRRELVLAVDPIGIKPLYYWTGADGTVLFASEIRALLAGGLVPRVLDPAAVDGYLAYGAVQGPSTIVRGIRALRGGTMLRIHAEGTVIGPERYWSPPFAETDAPPVDEARGMSRLRELLRLVVRQHLVGDVPVGVFLSGGIDSSSLVALMHEVAPGTVHSFSVTFAETPYSEGPYSRLIAERYSDKHQEVRLADEDLLDLLPGALAAMDQPTIDGINVYVISRAARESGLKVALSGQGGDEVFGGYPTFGLVSRALAWRRRLRLVPRGAWRLAAGLQAFRSRRRVIPDKLSEFLAGEGDVLSTFLLLRELFPGKTREALFPAGPIGTVRGLPRTVADELAVDIRLLDPVNQVSCLEMKTYLANMLLRDGDVMSMAHGLELRVPFLDRRLVEFVARIPGRQKLGVSPPKPWLVRAMGDALPRAIWSRPKQGFTLPWEDWLRGRLREQAAARLESRSLCESVGLDWHAAQSLWKAFLVRRPGMSWSRIWGIFVLLEWCSRHRVKLG